MIYLVDVVDDLLVLHVTARIAIDLEYLITIAPVRWRACEMGRGNKGK